MNITQQKEILEKALDIKIKLPSATGQYLIPNYKLLGTYNEAVEKVLDAIKKSRSFYNWLDGKLGSAYLQQLPVKENWWNKQPDVILVDAQLGEKWKGKSVNEALLSMAENELPCGAYEVGIILLTHTGILKSYDDLWLDCPGDEFSYVAGGRFDVAPYFSFSGGKVGFSTYSTAYPYGLFGSASFFLPQSVSRNLEPSASLETRVKSLEDDMNKLKKFLVV